mgnify:CR=1 FL=1
MPEYLLAHDLGTSGNKATLFTTDGTLIQSCVSGYGTRYYNGNWAEQNPGDWWKAVCASTKELIQGIDPSDIVAVAFSGQMMGCLCVDRNGTPLRPSIIWADQRAQAQAAALGEQISLRDFYHIAGHRNSASYGLQKLMWVRDNEPEVYAKTYKALNAKDFIVLRLTGKFYTEPSDATSNACIDLNTLQWSEKIVNASGIDGDKLPEIVPSTTVAGEVTPWAAGQTGLKAGTPVVMGGGDGLCSNVGAGSISPGRTFSCIGTSAWVATTSEKPLFDEEMRTFTWAHIVPGLYSPTGTMQAGGSSYNWLKGQVAKYETAVAKVQGISPYDLINAEEKGDLAYRKEQLKRLQDEVVDIEDMQTGISIMDLGLNEFRLDLLAFIKEHPDVDRAPHGMNAVVQSTPDCPPGVIFVMRNVSDGVNIGNQN